MTAKQMTQMRWMSVWGRVFGAGGLGVARLTEPHTQTDGYMRAAEYPLSTSKLRALNGERHQHFRFRLFMLKVWRRQRHWWVGGDRGADGNAHPLSCQTPWLPSDFLLFLLPSRWAGIYHVGPNFRPEFGSSPVLTKAVKLQETID